MAVEQTNLNTQHWLSKVQSLIRAFRWSTASARWATIGGILIALGLASFQQLFFVSGDLYKGVFTNIGVVSLTAGALSIFVMGICIWKEVVAPPPPPPPNKPDAIKGVSAFSDGDGELFWRLGRTNELTKLKNYIEDSQVPLVVFRGESGVGKTSILRAGLPYVLNYQGKSDTELNQSEKYSIVYWEAVTKKAEKSLLETIRADFKDEQAPTTLNRCAAVVNDSNPQVIIIDQAEQLDLNRDEGIFKALKSLLDQSPPYSSTWIISFRDDFSAQWFDFTLSLSKVCSSRIEGIPLKRFTEEKATRIISVLGEEAKISGLTHAGVEAIVKNISEDGTVSPVDIGIALVVLSEARFTNAETFSGQGSLMAAYLDHVLEMFPDGFHEIILKALFNLIDHEREQRKSEGVNGEKLAELAGSLNVSNFLKCLDYLEKSRVIERIEGNNYRLGHEKLIPGIRQLIGTQLAGAQEATLLLERRFYQWSGERRNQNLLRGKELQKVLNHKTSIGLKEKTKDKLEFIKRSKRQRLKNRFALVSSVGILLAITISLWVGIEKHFETTQAIASGIPRGINELSNKLKVLTVDSPNILSLGWLPEGIEELDLNLSNSNVRTLQGIPQSVKRLNLNLNGSLVRSLNGLPKNLKTLNAKFGDSLIDSLKGLPKELEILELNLGNSGVRALTELPTSLKELFLKIDRTRVQSLAGIPQGLDSLLIDFGSNKLLTLEKLPKVADNLSLLFNQSSINKLSNIPEDLKRLTLNFDTCEFKSLSGMPKKCDELSLNLGSSKVSSLNGLPVNLGSLTLDLGTSEVESLAGIPDSLLELILHNRWSKLKDFSGIPKQVKSLFIEMNDTDRVLKSKIQSLPRNLSDLIFNIKKSRINLIKVLPKNLPKLTLNLNGPKVKSLLIPNEDSGQEVKIPDSVTLLSLNLDGSGVSVLTGIPDKVKSLKLIVGKNEVVSLEGIPVGVTDLELNLKNSKVRNLNGIPKGVNSLELTLSKSPVSSLKYLPNNLSTFVVDLRDSRITSLEDIPRSVKDLTLKLGNSSIKDLKGLPQSLERLVLHMGHLDIYNFEQLPKSIKHLELNLEKCKVKNLIGIPNRLTSLSLNLGKSEVESFKGIPKSLSTLKIDLNESAINDVSEIVSFKKVELNI